MAKVDNMTVPELKARLVRAMSVIAYADGYCEGLGKPSDYLTEELDGMRINLFGDDLKERSNAK